MPTLPVFSFLRIYQKAVSKHIDTTPKPPCPTNATRKETEFLEKLPKGWCVGTQQVKRMAAEEAGARLCRSSVDHIEESGIHCNTIYRNLLHHCTLRINYQKDKSRKQLHVQLHPKE